MNTEVLTFILFYNYHGTVDSQLAGMSGKCLIPNNKKFRITIKCKFWWKVFKDQNFDKLKYSGLSLKSS